MWDNEATCKMCVLAKYFFLFTVANCLLVSTYLSLYAKLHLVTGLSSHLNSCGPATKQPSQVWASLNVILSPRRVQVWGDCCSWCWVMKVETRKCDEVKLELQRGGKCQPLSPLFRLPLIATQLPCYSSLPSSLVLCFILIQCQASWYSWHQTSASW